MTSVVSPPIGPIRYESVAGILPILMFVGFAALIITGIVFAAIQAQKRREAMTLLASELGLTFSPGRDYDHDDQFAHFEIFRRGHSRSAFNTLTGHLKIAEHSVPVKAGDFTYQVTSGSGKDRKTATYTFSYFIAHLPYANIPDLLIRPENVFDKIAGVFSDRDIDFESEEFSRRFMVASPDRKFAYDICHPRMIEFLLQTSPPAIDIEFGRLCLADGTRRWQPEQFRWAADFLNHFLTRWPDHVVKELVHRS